VGTNASLIESTESPRLRTAEICEEHMRVKMWIKTSRNAVGEAQSTQGAHTIVLAMTRTERVVLEVLNNAVDGLVVCGEESRSAVLWPKEYGNADRFRRNEEQLEGFDLSPR